MEQYRSRGDQGPWTDVYSLSATLYKMITGITPEDAMERIEKEELKKPSKLGISIPKNTENAIMNALNIKIEDRTQDMEAFEKELYHDENVKLKTVHLKKADVGKWPLWAKLTVSGASVAVATFAVLLITGVIRFSRIEIPEFLIPEGKTRVPNVVNEEVDYAQTTLKEAELYFQIVDKQYSEYIPQDMVLTQSINRGKIVDVNGVVEVVVSGGLEHVFMVDVYGYNKDEAIKILTALGLTVDIVEDYGDLDSGAVLEQSIAAGEETYRGAKVVLTVSKGYDSYLDKNQVVEVPDFTGMTLKEAQAAAKKCGLYIVKTGSKKGQMKAGCILEQTPKGGSEAHQGDTIEVITVEEEIEVYMPDVQYKDEVEAVAQLEALGLTVKVSYEKSSKVAQGKVISQSIEPYTKVKNGEKVSLVVSLGDDEINKVMAQWSDWMVELPAGVNKDQYEIETKTQYSFRDKSTTTSAQSSLPGWTYYDTVITKGEFGDWSEWSTSKPEEKSDREIVPKTQYASSDYQTTSSEQASMAGWTKIKTETKYRNEYGSWSEWSKTAQTKSDIRNVESKNQYQYRTKNWTTQVNNGALSGWQCDTSKTQVSYGQWTEHGETPISASSTLDVTTETRTRQVQTGTKYKYYHYKYWGANYNLAKAWYYTWAARGEYCSIETTSPLAESNPEEGGLWDGVKQGYGGTGSNLWFLESTSPIMENVNYTVYLTRPITTTYYFWQWSGWSDWTDGTKNGDSNTEVANRTMYRYQDKIAYNWYTYERWTDYTAWSDTSIKETSTRKVKTQTIYKYRNKKDVYTYYFYQWGDWSGWRDEQIEKSDEREVQARTMYRYKLKQ